METTTNENTREKKIKKYIEETENPYCFLCGETKVTMCFSDDGEPIEKMLKRYITAMSSGPPMFCTHLILSRPA